MKLYNSPASPYGRKVAVALHLAGALDGVETVAGSGTPMEPSAATLAANPLGKIPALVTDDGIALFDSRVITRWIDARFGLGLYPEPPALWPVLVREALADGVMDAALLIVHEARFREPEARHAAYVEGQTARILRALDAMEAEAHALPERPDAAAIALAAALFYLDLRLPGLAWRETRPALAAFAARMAALPAFAETAPPPG